MVKIPIIIAIVATDIISAFFNELFIFIY
jgi:hypothetical protein